MARLFTTGFEIPNYPEPFLQGTNLWKFDTLKRTGSYSLNVWGPTIGSGAYRYGILDANKEELYVRVAVRYGDADEGIFMMLQDVNGSNLVTISTKNGFPVKLTCNGQYVESEYIYLSGDWMLVEVHAKIHDTEGVCEMRVNGVMTSAITGDTKPGANTIRRISLGVAGGIGDGNNFDDIACNDTSGTEDNSWCGDGRIVALRPENNASVQWLPYASANNFAEVDDVTPDADTTYVYTAGSGAKDLYNTYNPSLPSNTIVKRVWIEALARKTDPETTMNLQIGLKSGATEAWSSDIALSTIYTHLYGPHYKLNPDDSEDWSRDDINALQIGIKST